MTEEDIVQAGELALGVLDGDERAAALRRVLAEPGFAAEVTRWRHDLATLVGAPAAVEPSPAVARAILAIPDRPRRAAGRWRLATLAASAVAACLALVLVRPGQGDRPPARILVAALAGTDGGKPFSAVYDPRSARVAVVGAAPWPRGRSAELWLIAPGAPPRALGLLTRGARSSVALDDARRPAVAPGATLAVSVEPAGGSTTGLPTGPVVASGELIAG